MTENQRKNLIEFIDTLRRTDKKQTDGQLFSKETGAVCALGLASIYFDIEPAYEYEELDRHDWNAKFGLEVSQNTIIRLNDVEGMTFPEIADYIEYNYLEKNKNDNDSKK